MRAQQIWLDEANRTDNPMKDMPATQNGNSFRELTDELQVLERTSDYIISTWRHVMFLTWRGPETAAGIARSRSLMDPWARHKPGGVVLVILMPPLAAMKQPPNDEARKAMAETSQDASDAFKGIAIIGNESGFIGSVIRSVMTARQVFTHSSVPFKLFSSAADAAPWIARCLELKSDLRSEFCAVAEKASWKCRK